MNPPIPDEQYPLHWTHSANDRDRKKELLKYFFENEDIRYENDVPVNYSKFLYLYGEANTGKLELVKEVALEVFGNTWESKIYIRNDDGQRYPYKLHAHKVESSRKVLFLSDKRVHWRKWQDLYRATNTFYFTGAEVPGNTRGEVTIRYTDFNQQFMADSLQFRSELYNTIDSFFNQHGISPTLAESLRSQIPELFRTYTVNTRNNFTRNEV